MIQRLDTNGNGDYLRHPREVSYLQDMLPRREKLEYIRREKSYTGTDFNKLKLYLLERKEALKTFGLGDKGNDEKPDKKTEHCEYCSIPGHKESDCIQGTSADANNIL